MQNRLLFIGIDGASWPVIEKLLQNNRLPNFKRLKALSAYSELETVFPPHTGPGWASMFTGAGPGQHGIYQFWATQSHEYNPALTTVEDYSCEPIWRTLERHGKSVGLVNIPMSHPPKPLKNGFMITWPLKQTIQYCEPKSLIKELAEQNLHYHSDLINMYRGQDDFYQSSLDIIDKRTATLKYLMSNYPVDAMFMVYTEIDRISHYFWGENDFPDELVCQAYQHMDTALGEILDFIPNDTMLVVGSDHGFGNCRYNLNIHNILEKYGLLQTKLIKNDDIILPPGSDGLPNDGASAWFQSMFNYKRVVDWPNTQVYMPTPGCFGLNINLKHRQKQGCVEEKNIDAISKNLKDIVANITDPDDGSQLFELQLSETVYSGDEVKLAPDYILMPKKWDIMPHPSLDTGIFVAPTQKAIHRMDGVYFFNARAVPSQKTKIKITDITPSILHCLELPIQDGLDGDSEVLGINIMNIIKEKKINYKKSGAMSAEEKQLIENQLVELGYL